MAGLTFSGTVQVGAGACGSAPVVSGCPSIAQLLLTLAARCGAVYPTVIPLPEQLSINTGTPGTTFVDLDALAQLTSVEMLYLTANQPIKVRIGAAEAVLVGSGGAFPTLFAGGEGFNVTIDGVAVAVTFQAGDQTAAQCAARINAACALAGLATPRATVATSGQLQISGVLTGAQGSVVVTGGTGRTALGFAGTPSAVGAGADVPLWGTMLIEFPQPGAVVAPPTRIQVSGVALLSGVAAGR